LANVRRVVPGLLLSSFVAVCAELAARDILCDSRPDVGLRLGPHFFNSDDDLRFAVDQITEIVGSRAAAITG